MEIVPGVGFEQDLRNRNAVNERLLQEGIKFWDFNIRNVGRIPVKTPGFPDGVSAVTDRPSVQREPDNEQASQAQLRMTEDDIKKYREAAETIENLYGPLRQLFSAQNMKPFWDMCRSYVQQNKLIAGWNEKRPEYEFDDQANYAANVAMHYAEKLQFAGQPVSSSIVTLKGLEKYGG